MKAQFHVFSLKKAVGFIICILIPLAVGSLSTLITDGSVDIYNAFIKPPFSPPAFAFPVAWTVLYILMGFASYFVWSRGSERAEVKDALNYYAIQLVLNFLWPIVFFTYRMPFLAFLVLLVLWIFIGITAAKFYRMSHSSGILMLPYWIWVTFAGYLNLAIWLLNR